MAFAALVAAVGWSSTVIDSENQTITITIDSETTTIADALAAATLGDDAVALDYSSLNGTYAAYKIVKKGAGILLFEDIDNSSLSSWTGDLQLDAGVVMAKMHKDATDVNQYQYLLGNGSGKVKVAAGASLYIDCLGFAKNYYNGLVRPVYITGTGTTAYPGAMAIKFASGGRSGGLRRPYPMTVHLDGNATICFLSGTEQIVVPDSRKVYMYGHELTYLYTNPGTSTFSFIDTNKYYPGATISDKNANAKLIFDKVVLSSRASAGGIGRNYSVGNEIIFRNNGSYSFGNNDNVHGEHWTLVYESTAGGSFLDNLNTARYISGTTSNSVGVVTNGWKSTSGAGQSKDIDIGVTSSKMVLNRDLVYTYNTFNDNGWRWSYPIYDHNTTWMGEISGVGGITLNWSTYKKTYNYKHKNFNFGGANTFTGSLTVSDATLGLFNPAAIPASASSVSLTNTWVYIGNGANDPATTYQLRAAQFNGTSIITNAANTGVVKVAGTPVINSGTLEVAVPFTDDSTVEIKSGAKLKVTDERQVITLGTLKGSGTIEIADAATVRVAALANPVTVAAGVLELAISGEKLTQSFGVGKYKLVPGEGKTVSFAAITCVEGTEIDCGGADIEVGAINGPMPVQINGSLKLTDDSKAVNCGGNSVKIEVSQDAAKRRANLKGLWSGVLQVQNTDKTKANYTTKIYDNALADTTADFYNKYYEDAVVTEMAPMTHVTTWPPEGSEHAGKWTADGKNTAADPFWLSDPQRYKTWKGYVWNDSSTNETWTVINCNNAYVDVRLNGGQCYKASATDTRYLVDMTYSGERGYSRNTYIANTHLTNLTYVASAKKTQISVVPGANEFKVRYYSRWNSCRYWPGSIETNLSSVVFSKWSEGHGLVFDRKGRGTTDIDNYEDFKDATGQLLTREMTDAFPYIKSAGATVDLCGNETATGMLIGDVQASNGSLVVDGVWNLTKAEVEDGVASTGLKFNELSRLVITDATMQNIYDDMSTANAKASGYQLATGVAGNIKPKLVRAASDRRMSLVLKGGTLTLVPGLGTLVIAK